MIHKQEQLAVDALNEEQKFLEYLGSVTRQKNCWLQSTICRAQSVQMPKLRWTVGRITQILLHEDQVFFASVQHWSMDAMCFYDRRLEALARW